MVSLLERLTVVKAAGPGKDVAEYVTAFRSK